ncbi:hypothetical protein NKH77_12335 [Streptomyces sp. M19]
MPPGEDRAAEDLAALPRGASAPGRPGPALPHERGRPRPLSYRRAAAQLDYLRPGDGWTQRKVEAVVAAVRRHLHAVGFPHPLLHDKDSGPPSDNRLLHNLLTGLVESTTLVPPDLDLLEP